MTDVVINKCYGGFSLSDEAEDLYAKKSGFQIFRYRQTKHRLTDGEDLYERALKGEHPGRLLFTFKVDHGDAFSKFPEGKDAGYWWSRELERDDPVLVEVVRELGSGANGPFASLSVVSIPDGVSWEIDEYDGIEHVAEAHRTWG